MRCRYLVFLFLLLAFPLAAPAQQASLPGALYKSDAEGWQVQPPKVWKYALQGGKLMIGSDTEAGLMLAWFQPGVTYEQAVEYAKQPYEEQGLVLTPGPAAPFATKAGRALVVEYTGQAMDGSTIKSRAVAIVGAKGVVYAVGVTTQPQFAALSKRVDELAKGVSFFTPKVGAGVALINGPMCAWSGSSSGSSSYSSSQRMNFDGKGNVTWGSESSFSGSIKDGSGDTTATYGGYGGNVNKPSDLGRYTVVGEAVTIVWGDGSTMACTAHHKNGTQIVELMCGNKKLWGRGLCE